MATPACDWWPNPHLTVTGGHVLNVWSRPKHVATFTYDMWPHLRVAGGHIWNMWAYLHVAGGYTCNMWGQPFIREVVS